MAVHSLKDLPTAAVEGLVLAAVPLRGPVGDVFVSRRFRRFDDLPQGATVATSSLRCRALGCWTWPARPASSWNLRGNVEIPLTQAGRARYFDADSPSPRPACCALGWHARHRDHGPFVDAACGGARSCWGWSARRGWRNVGAAAAPLDDLPTRQAVLAERAMPCALGGGMVWCRSAAGQRRGRSRFDAAERYRRRMERNAWAMETVITAGAAEELGQALAETLLRSAGRGALLAM